MKQEMPMPEFTRRAKAVERFETVFSHYIERTNPQASDAERAAIKAVAWRFFSEGYDYSLTNVLDFLGEFRNFVASEKIEPEMYYR